MPTIKDISDMVGVSKATVSRAINGTGQVSPQTKKAIFDAIKALNFRPNSLAQALASNRSNSVGLVLSDFDGYYFGSLMKQASKIAEKNNKQLIVTDGHNCPDGEREAIQFLADRKCDVIILYSRQMSVDDLIAFKDQLPIPIINVGRCLPASAGYSVGFNQTQAASLAVMHLIELGHKHIAYLGPPTSTNTAQLRFKAYVDQMLEHKLAINENLQIKTSEFCVQSGYQAALELLARGEFFTAIFAASDDIAIGALRALRESGVCVPEQVSIIGIDNEEKSEFVVPSLTSIELPLSTMTHHIMDIAQQLMEGGSPAPEPLSLDSVLIKRESTSRVR
jgi:DNA-binding LacI/PurR family transcriptional regulator